MTKSKMKAQENSLNLCKQDIAIGEEQAKLKAERNMLLEVVPIDKIASWQDLPLETVQQLAEDLKAQVSN